MNEFLIDNKDEKSYLFESNSGEEFDNSKASQLKVLKYTLNYIQPFPISLVIKCVW